MAFDAHRNLAISSVATAPSPPASGLTLTVSAGHGARFPAGEFNVTIWPATAAPDPVNAEIARVTARAGDVLTLLRSQEGSTARAIGTGDLIAQTITAKTLQDIETQAALLAAPNVFTASQAIQTVSPRVKLIDPSAPVEARFFEMVNHNQLFRVQALNDAGTVAHSIPLMASRSGDVYAERSFFEAGRSVPLGWPQPWPFSPTNFNGTGGQVWTVGAPAFIGGTYTLAGHLLVWSFYLSWFSGSNVLTGTPAPALEITAPAGRIVLANQWQIAQYQAGTAGAPAVNGLIIKGQGNSKINISKLDGSPFPNTDTPGMIVSLIFQTE